MGWRDSDDDNAFIWNTSSAFLQCEIPRTRVNVLIPGARDIFDLMSSSVYEVVKFKLNSLCIM